MSTCRWTPIFVQSLGKKPGQTGSPTKKTRKQKTHYHYRMTVLRSKRAVVGGYLDVGKDLWSGREQPPNSAANIFFVCLGEHHNDNTLRETTTRIMVFLQLHLEKERENVYVTRERFPDRRAVSFSPKLTTVRSFAIGLEKNEKKRKGSGNIREGKTINIYHKL